ncbi:alpha/beta hydrolase [Roseomonas sp. SG15]|uniref:Alpha/beta hydrolase n=2 Tax=Roseomonas indoligenes TaxID=2820811 RepID=A0A940MUV3_9PROT|nr:alpha/beta hydrolase [Pararoseomonas indoligenes]MBP0491184.1 alpha/beta hydrolase [Pararoseomonas indoligenes]
MTGQAHPTHAALIEAFEREGEAGVAALRPALDIPYGPHPRERFDFYAAPGAWRGTLAYFHAGYWQSRDKVQFRFLAPLLVARGLDVAMVNYPLCPDVTLPALLESTRRAVPAVLARAASLGRGGAALVAAGHSAGGQIVAGLALHNWGGASPIAAVAGLSGVYDLEPLVGTPLNDRLRLDVETARALSPVRRVRGGMPPAFFAVGGKETPAFLAQNARMARAWANAGNLSGEYVSPGTDHFSLLRDPVVMDGIAALSPAASP